MAVDFKALDEAIRFRLKHEGLDQAVVDPVTIRVVDSMLRSVVLAINSELETLEYEVRQLRRDVRA